MVFQKTQEQRLHYLQVGAHNTLAPLKTHFLAALQYQDFQQKLDEVYPAKISRARPAASLSKLPNQASKIRPHHHKSMSLLRCMKLLILLGLLVQCFESPSIPSVYP